MRFKYLPAVAWLGLLPLVFSPAEPGVLARSHVFSIHSFKNRSAAAGAAQAADADSKVASLFQQAQQAQSRGDFQAAAAIYQDILKLEPHLAGAWMNLGL